MIVGLVAAIRPVSFDMSKPLTVDITCGSLNLTARTERERCGYDFNSTRFSQPHERVFRQKAFIESEELLPYRNVSEINVGFLAGLYLSVVKNMI